MTRHCDGCGRYIDKDVDACPDCGTALEDPDDDAAEEERRRPEREPKTWREYGNIGARVILAQIAVGIIMLIPYLLMQHAVRPLIYRSQKTGILLLIVLFAVYIGVYAVVAGRVVYSLYGWK